MYYVPDDTERCGYYECDSCGSRFLDVRIVGAEDYDLFATFA